ncbi:hypothetical protein NQZ79_g3485 [Umbelopsis isabellina]|nr:hypothetical protein NQZ79_g3485 [Umbelopsis isabellina]
MIQIPKLPILRRTLYSIIVFSAATLSLFWWASSIPVKQSEWTCRGEGRQQICEFTNFCINRHDGPFIISNQEPPSINLINADQDSDIWFTPKVVSGYSNPQFVNETLFVYGLYSPFHFSHFLYNGLMPLYSAMKEFNAAKTAWTLRAATFWNQHTIPEMDLPTEHDLVLEKEDAQTSKQSLAPKSTICFSKAVVGTGNRCSLWYCDGQISAAHYQSFKEFVLSKPAKNECTSTVYKTTGSIQVGILNRGKTRHITNLPEVIEELSKLDVSIKTIDFDAGCDLQSTAHLVKDLDVLIAPFGNGLGAGLFMKSNSIVISIASRWYNEDWFKWPMTAIGRRMYNFECNSPKCQEYDQKLLDEILTSHNVELNAQERQQLMTQQNPVQVLSKHIPGEEWKVIEQYHKDVPRRIDMESFTPFLANLLDSGNNSSYVELCRNNQCCNHDCTGPLERNVFGTKSAWTLS